MLSISQITDSQEFIRGVSDLLVSTSASVKHIPRSESMPSDLPPVASRPPAAPKPPLRSTFTESTFVVKRLAARFHTLDQGDLEPTGKSVSFVRDSSSRMQSGSNSAVLPPLRHQRMSIQAPQPLTTVLSEFSKRIEFRRRVQMMDRNLVIVNFEGVLGCFGRPRPWSRKKQKVTIRENAFTAVSQLITAFQVVLFCLNPNTKVKSVLSLFESSGVRFDAVYKSVSVPEKPPFTQNYDQVLRDFLALSCHVMVLPSQIFAPLEQSEADIAETTEEETVIHRFGRRLCDVYV